jgi:hypothetical protein
MLQADPAPAGSRPLRRLAVALPVLVWLATGLTQVPDGERAIASATVLQAGPHLLAPWPLSHVTRLDDGAVHDIALPTTPKLRALFRIGLTDEAAMKAATIADPDAFITTMAAALALPETPIRAARLQTALAPNLSAAGFDLLAVTAPPQTPPAPPGSDPAPLVIAARADAAARRIAAKSQAAETIAAARAKAAEIVDAARTDLVNFTADQAAARAGGRAFLLERYFANLSSALAQSPKTIIDHRLNWPEAPELDLRPPSGLATGETTK